MKINHVMYIQLIFGLTQILVITLQSWHDTSFHGYTKIQRGGYVWENGQSAPATETQQQSRFRNARQCDRDYSKTLNFASNVTWKDSCPAMPHNALANGTRPSWSTLEAPGTFHVEGCTFKWFLPEEACDLVASIGAIYFDGDSLIRQLMVGFGAVLDGNFRSGGLARATPKEYLVACQCDQQWHCWKDPANHRFGPNEIQFALCPKWTRNHVIAMPFDKYMDEYAADIDHPMIVVGNGMALHKSLSFRIVQKQMEARLNAAQSTGGTYVPVTVHWPGPNKPKSYIRTQGEEKVEIYNEKLKKWAKEKNIWPLETYEYTRGTWSRDGVHYDDENIVFAQMLLNLLWRLQEQGKLPVVSEESKADPSSFIIGRPKDVNVEAYVGPVPRPY